MAPVNKRRTGEQRLMPERQLVFNGIQAADGSYRRRPRSLAEFAAETRHQRRDVPMYLPRHLEASDLSQAGWGVVFGRSVPEGHRSALKDLMDLRKEEAGDLFRDDLQYSGGNWLAFLRENKGSLAAVDPSKVPYYLLLVGGPEDFDFEFQTGLGVTYAVGRLAFESEEEYAHYAAGAVAAEKAFTSRPRRVDFFGVRNWDDDNTTWSERDLVEPLADSLMGFEQFEVRRTLREEARKGALVHLLGEDTPSLLFVNCHGVNFWPEDPLQASDQGALLCYDWPGPRIWGQRRIPDSLYVASRDVAEDADLRGLIAFFFSCYGIGTPEHDSFDRSADQRRIAHRDLLGALPQRLLGHPNGALAVVGHVDQVWCHSYSWQGLGSQIGHFESAFKLLMRGERVGLALEDFAGRLGTLDFLMVEEQEKRRKAGKEALSDDEQQVLLWTAHYDALNHALLGDPAVRLPRAAVGEDRRDLGGRSDG